MEDMGGAGQEGGTHLSWSRRRSLERAAAASVMVSRRVAKSFFRDILPPRLTRSSTLPHPERTLGLEHVHVHVQGEGGGGGSP